MDNNFSHVITAFAVALVTIILSTILYKKKLAKDEADKIKAEELRKKSALLQVYNIIVKHFRT